MPDSDPLKRKQARTARGGGEPNGVARPSAAAPASIAALPAVPEVELVCYSWEDPEERRSHVARLKALGATHIEIGKSLDPQVSRNTISADVAEIREAARLRVVKPDSTKELVSSLARLEGIYNLAARECAACPEQSNARGGYLKLMLDVTTRTDALKVDTGLIERHVDDGKSRAHALLGFDPTDMTPEAIKSKAAGIMADMLVSIDVHSAKEIVLMMIQQLRERGVSFVPDDLRTRRATAGT